jgi:hypothetical protein
MREFPSFLAPRGASTLISYEEKHMHMMKFRKRFFHWWGNGLAASRHRA